MVSKSRGRLKSLFALAIAGLLLVAFMAPAMAKGPGNSQGNGNGNSGNGSVSSQATSNGCIGTGVFDGSNELEAHYVNEVPNGSLDVTCDIGIYFDEDGLINNADVNGTVAGSKSVQYGIYVNAADVDVTGSTVTVEDDYGHQFISISYRNGATGTVRNNDLSGAHRVGVGIRGNDTDVRVQGNSISGTGAHTSGWAENGIQVDQGATADIRNNTVSGHWWDGGTNWASTGIMLYGSDGSKVTNNTLVDNEFSVYVFGHGNRVTGNRSSSDIVSQATPPFVAWGILIAGNDNDLTGNRLSATDGGAGIYIFPGSEGNRLNGNRISGFGSGIVDGGSDNVARGNPFVTDDGVEVQAHPQD